MHWMISLSDETNRTQDLWCVDNSKVTQSHAYDHAPDDLSIGWNKQNTRSLMCRQQRSHTVTCIRSCTRRSLHWTKQTEPKSSMCRQQQSHTVTCIQSCTRWSIGWNKQNARSLMCKQQRSHTVTCIRSCTRRCLHWTKQTEPKSTMCRQQQSHLSWSHMHTTMHQAISLLDKTDPKSMMCRQQQAEVVDYRVVVSLPSLDVMTTLMRC